MKGYIAQLAPSGLRQFLPEHAVPADFLRQLVREWSARPRAAVWAVLAEPDAEAIRTGQYGVTKGVVCKGGSGGPDLWATKIKTYAYLERLKRAFGERREDYWE